VAVLSEREAPPVPKRAASKQREGRSERVDEERERERQRETEREGGERGRERLRKRERGRERMKEKETREGEENGGVNKIRRTWLSVLSASTGTGSWRAHPSSSSVSSGPKKPSLMAKAIKDFNTAKNMKSGVRRKKLRYPSRSPFLSIG
jgi:hypothetical protein